MLDEVERRRAADIEVARAKGTIELGPRTLRALMATAAIAWRQCADYEEAVRHADALLSALSPQEDKK